MSYLNVANASLSAKDSNHGWQVRMAIDPRALHNPEQLQLIQLILAKLQARYAIACRIYNVKSDSVGELAHSVLQDDLNLYAPGKEICIHFPNSSLMDVVTCKALLLELWSEMLQCQIPIIYRDVIGDKKLLGENGMPTPFSISSRRKYVKVDEDKNPLFKEFIPYDMRHPLMHVLITNDDLYYAYINLNVRTIAKESHASYVDYYDKQIAKLRMASSEMMNALRQNLFSEQVDITDAAEIKQNYYFHTITDDCSARTTYVNWSEYIENYSPSLMDALVDRQPSAMKIFYEEVIKLERERKSFNTLQDKYKQYALYENFGSDKAYEALCKLAKRIRHMEYLVSHGLYGISTDMLEKFKVLYDTLEHDMLNHPKCELDTTPYLTVLEHFNEIAYDINRGWKHSEEEMTELSEQLHHKLTKTPMSRVLKAAIYGVVGAIVGASIGMVVGAAVTFWGGGFGSLPAAICGGLLGISMAQGLALGGAAVGAGAAMGALTGGFGLFKAQKSHHGHQNKLADLEKIDRPIFDLHHCINPDVAHLLRPGSAKILSDYGSLRRSMSNP